MRTAHPDQLETLRSVSHIKMEVARVPTCVRRTVHRRLTGLAEYLEDVLEPDELQYVFSMFAGVVHQVSRGMRRELAQEIHERAEELKDECPDHDDLVAAAELEDLADDMVCAALEGEGL